MDSLSQIVLGAAVGEAVLGKKIGNKAPLLGAVLGTIPDLDIIFRTGDVLSDTFTHRGFSHSITFALLIGIFGALIFWKFYQKWDKKSPKITYFSWFLFFFLTVFTHPLLDYFTTWGTSLLYPFSDYKFAQMSVFIIDPLYTLPFLGLLIMAIRTKNKGKRYFYNMLGIVISTSYLFWGVISQAYATHQIENILELNGLKVDSSITFATPLNSFIWGYAGIKDDKIIMTYYSIFDSKLGDIRVYGKNSERFEKAISKKQLELVNKITKGNYFVAEDGDNFIMVDVKFGQPFGYKDIDSDFAFAYEFKKNGDKYDVSWVRFNRKELMSMPYSIVSRIVHPN